MSAGRLDTIITQRVETALGVSLSARTELSKVNSSNRVTPAGKAVNVPSTESATQKPNFAQLVLDKGTVNFTEDSIQSSRPSSARASDTMQSALAPAKQHVVAPDRSTSMQLSPAGRILLAVFGSHPGGDKPLTSRQPLFISAVMQLREQELTTMALDGMPDRAKHMRPSPLSTSPTPLGPTGQASSMLAQALSQVLSQVISQSGLFYEAQMLRTFRSMHPNTALLREQPQGRNPPESKLLAIDEGADDSPQRTELMSLIRQQLDLLSNPMIHWSGHAWPDVSMQWRFSRDAQDSATEQGEQETPGQDQSDPNPSWSSTVDLELPQLGQVKAIISINDQTVALEISVDPARALIFKRNLFMLEENLHTLGATVKELKVTDK